jgi:hypothetical protein
MILYHSLSFPSLPLRPSRERVGAPGGRRPECFGAPAGRRIGTPGGRLDRSRLERIGSLARRGLRGLLQAFRERAGVRIERGQHGGGSVDLAVERRRIEGPMIATRIAGRARFALAQLFNPGLQSLLGDYGVVEPAIVACDPSAERCGCDLSPSFLSRPSSARRASAISSLGIEAAGTW